MELLAILTLLFLVGFVVAINPTRIMKALFCIATFYIGLMVVIEGITLNSDTVIAINSQTGFVLFVFMTLGSLVTMYGAIIGERGREKDR